MGLFAPAVLYGWSFICRDAFAIRVLDLIAIGYSSDSDGFGRKSLGIGNWTGKDRKMGYHRDGKGRILGYFFAFGPLNG